MAKNIAKNKENFEEKFERLKTGKVVIISPVDNFSQPVNSKFDETFQENKEIRQHFPTVTLTGMRTSTQKVTAANYGSFCLIMWS